MNHHLLIATFAVTLLPSLAFAQVYQGNLLLASQNDVNAASAYTSVTGNLTISGADIVDLGPLAGFTQVGGFISMDGNPLLTSVIDGFPSLTDVGGGMFFYNNDSLLVFSGFDALLQTGDNIDFWFNDVVTSITGFASLQTAGWSLEFGGNPNLLEIPEFSSLQTISSSLFILDNPNLQAITGFPALQSVSWSFQINNNTSLNELCGLYDFFTVSNPYTGGGAFDITNNGPGLPSPTTIAYVLGEGPCATWSPYGAGCAGPGGVKALQLVSPPAIGGTFALDVTNVGPGFVFMISGLNQLSIPVPIAPFVSGCTALTSPDLAQLLPTVGSTASWSLAIPNTPSLAGFQLFNQALELDAMWSLSDGGVGTLQ